MATDGKLPASQSLANQSPASQGDGGPGSCRHPLDPVVEIMATLRGPNGCPWDREQTHASLSRYLVEEACEVLEAIEDGDPEALCEELGDLLLQVVFHAQIAAERGAFTIDDVVRGLADKLIRRHPHVFGGPGAPDAQTVLARWEAIKQAERPPGAARKRGQLPRHLPALLLADKALRRAEEAGRPAPFGPARVAARDAATADSAAATRAAGAAEDEAARDAAWLAEGLRAAREAVRRRDREAALAAWGDLLLALAAIGRQLDLDSEAALRQAVRRRLGEGPGDRGVPNGRGGAAAHEQPGE